MSDWRPTAGQTALRARASLLRQIRDFFDARGVLEVETPLLCQRGVTDPALEALSLLPPGESRRFLQTSPEYPMKRLLAAGSGDIFQICKAFRAAELGARHNPEYTLLEWYRIGFDQHRLLREVAELLCELTDQSSWMIWPWAALFEEFLGIDAHAASSRELEGIARSKLGDIPADLDREQLLDLLMTACIEPGFAGWGMVFVVDYPDSQAALAHKFERQGVGLGARFECFLHGVELANGYWECADADELRQRFVDDNSVRALRGQPEIALDERFLAGMTSGMPDCAGVALGIDRLLALILGEADLKSVLAFPWQSA